MNTNSINLANSSNNQQDISADKSHTSVNTKDSSKLAAQQRWSIVQSSLQSALSDWAVLENTVGSNPDDEQLAKVKTMIADLKDQLDQF